MASVALTSPAPSVPENPRMAHDPKILERLRKPLEVCNPASRNFCPFLFLFSGVNTVEHFPFLRGGIKLKGLELGVKYEG